MRALIIELFLKIILELFPVVRDATTDTTEESKQQPQLKKRLQDKIRCAGWVPILLSVILLSVGGCGTHSIYVPNGEPVRLREDLDNVKVWVMTEDGPKAAEMDLPNGWYCLPDTVESE